MLTRSRPEEAVLGVCKTSGGVGSDASVYGCMRVKNNGQIDSCNRIDTS